MINLNDLKPNPNNPRLIKDDKFKKLCASLKRHPEYLLTHRIAFKDGVIFGGNMRYLALKEIGYTEIPDEYGVDISGWNEESIREFIIIDNISYGENDWDLLANEYSKEELEEWGLDADNWGTIFEGKNTEIDVDELGKDLDLECPKCHFKFKKNV